MTSDFTVHMDEYLPLREVVFNTLRQAILKGELNPQSISISYHSSSSSVIRFPSTFKILKLLSDTLRPSQFLENSIY